MDVRIGIIHSARELDIDLPEAVKHDDVVADVEKALSQPDGVLVARRQARCAVGGILGQDRLRRGRRRRRGPARGVRGHLTAGTVPEVAA